MNKILVSILNAHFKNCLYGNNFVNKLSSITNNEYNIKEVYYKDGMAQIAIGDECYFNLTLSKNNYILNISISDK